MTEDHDWDCRLILKQNKYTYLFDYINHKKFKNKILKAIEQTPANKTQGVYKTDWKVDKSVKRVYWENYVKHIANTCIDILKKDLYKEVNQETIYHNHWFHIYQKNYGFGWHTHGESNFSGIYYLQLKEDNKTEFIDMDLSIEEGNLLIFPSFLLHRSPMIKNKTKKIIISFNFSMQ